MFNLMNFLHQFKLLHCYVKIILNSLREQRQWHIIVKPKSVQCPSSWWKVERELEIHLDSASCSSGYQTPPRAFPSTMFAISYYGSRSAWRRPVIHPRQSSRLFSSIRVSQLVVTQNVSRALADFPHSFAGTVMYCIVFVVNGSRIGYGLWICCLTYLINCGSRRGNTKELKEGRADDNCRGRFVEIR